MCVCVCVPVARRWTGCGGSQYAFPDALKADYGTPLSTCEETGLGTGVFTRVYSNTKVCLCSGGPRVPYCSEFPPLLPTHFPSL